VALLKVVALVVLFVVAGLVIRAIVSKTATAAGEIREWRRKADIMIEQEGIAQMVRQMVVRPVVAHANKTYTVLRQTPQKLISTITSIVNKTEGMYNDFQELKAKIEYGHQLMTDPLGRMSKDVEEVLNLTQKVLSINQQLTQVVLQQQLASQQLAQELTKNLTILANDLLVSTLETSVKGTLIGLQSAAQQLQNITLQAKNSTQQGLQNLLVMYNVSRTVVTVLTSKDTNVTAYIIDIGQTEVFWNGNSSQAQRRTLYPFFLPEETHCVAIHRETAVWTAPMLYQSIRCRDCPARLSSHGKLKDTIDCDKSRFLGSTLQLYAKHN
jgi:phenylpyruvate tautomerase PptA (4-oxalocrotonate tautomerase family)